MQQPTYEDLAKWAGQQIADAHTTNGRYDPDKCDCGSCAFAQAAADHFQELADRAKRQRVVGS
jgi:hypothetical protein